MPSITGIELLEKVKEVNSGIARILISAFDPDDELFKNSLCIDEFLPKPITMADLIDRVKKYVNYIVKEVQQPPS
jgi:YesN/AraC family two-component response regulator